MTLRNEDTGVTRTVASGSEGRYVLPALAPGRYRLRAELSGFATEEVRDLVITIGLELRHGQRPYFWRRCWPAAALYPNLWPASGDAALSITIFNAAAGRHALRVGLTWWTGGMLLASGYVVFVYRMFRGKVPAGHSSST